MAAKRGFVVLLVLALCQNALAGDFTRTFMSYKADSKPHSPHKASVLSAVLPGAGQVYNKKYWKVPLVYAGLGALTYSIINNQREFRSYQNELIARADNDSSAMNPSYLAYPVQYLRSNRDFHRNNRDLSIVGVVAFYALNIVDATVDAHLYKFDVDKSLSLRAKPVPLFNRTGFHAGANVGLVLRF